MDKKFTRIFSFILAFMMLFQFSMPAITSFAYDEKEQGLAENNVDVKKENEKISKDSNKAPPKMVEPLKLDEKNLESSFSGEDEVVPEISEMKDVSRVMSEKPSISEADGSKIETITVEWLTPDSVKDDKEEELNLKWHNDDLQKVQLRINYALSGGFDYPAGAIQISIPKAIFRDRSGKLVGTPEFAVLEAPDKSGDFAYVEKEDSYVFINTKKLSAATQGYIEMSFKNLIPHTIKDMATGYKTDDFNATVKIQTKNGQEISKKSNDIHAIVDTRAYIDQARKTVSNVSKTWSDSYPSELKPEKDADKYVYIAYSVCAYSNGSQPFKISMKDVASMNDTGGLFEKGEPIVLGYQRSDGTIIKGDGTNILVDPNRYEGFTTGYNFYGTVYVAYPPIKHLKLDTLYRMANTVEFTMTSLDDKEVTKTSDNAHKDYQYSIVDFEPTGHFWVDKEGGEHFNYALNKLQKGESIPELTYMLRTSAFGYKWTKDPNSTTDEMSDYKKVPYKVIVTDDQISFGKYSNHLTSDDFEFTKLDFRTPTIYDYVKYSGTRKGYFENSDHEIEYGDVGTNYYGYKEVFDNSKMPDLNVKVAIDGKDYQDYATVSYKTGKIVITKKDGSVINGNVLDFPKNTTDFKVEYSTTTPAVIFDMYPSVKIKTTKAIKDYVDGLFKESETPVDSICNTAGMEVELYGKLAGVNKDRACHTLSSFAHGSNLTKSVSYEATEKDNIRTRTVDLHYISIMRHQTNAQTRSDLNDAIKEGLYKSNSEAIWYDLLPKGVKPDTKSLRISNGNITNVQLIENYKNTDRILMIVKTKVEPKNNYSSSRNFTGYEGFYDEQTLSFDAKYTWESLSDYGRSLDNVIAYEGIADSLGNLKGYKGEPDNPLAGNHNNSKSGVSNVADIMTDLNKDHDKPVFLYAHADTNIVANITAKTSLRKDVDVNEEGVFGDGQVEELAKNVFENGLYTYRLRIKNTDTTKAKDIVFYDNLEKYVPDKSSDDYKDTQWKGTFVDLDLSSLKAKGIKPVVYYSTRSDLDLQNENNRKHNNLKDSSVWTTTMPKDKSTIKAIAIDASKKEDGSNFVLGTSDSIAAFIKMKAPEIKEANKNEYFDKQRKVGETEEGLSGGSHAYNNVVSIMTEINAKTGVEGKNKLIRYDYTKVGLKPFSIKVKKNWDDDNNRDGKRVDEATLRLYANGKRTDNIVRLNKDNKWSGEFNATYLDENSKPIQYSISEDEVEGYNLRINKIDETKVGINYDVSNVHVPEKINFKGNKKWFDDNDKVRPKEIKVNLYANDKLVKTQNIRGTGDNWEYEFRDLFKYENGKVIDYKIKEQVTDKAYYSEVKGNLIENHYYPYGDVELEKKVLNGTNATKDKEYEFTVYFTDKDGKADGNSYKYEIINSSILPNGKGELKNGYTFKLKENQKIVIKDVSVYSKVEFKEKEKAGFKLVNDLKAEPKANDKVSLVAKNDYKTIGKINIKAKKTLENKQLNAYDFIFDLYKDGKIIKSASNLKDGLVYFSSLYFDNKDIGKTYEYVIKERVNDSKGMTFDTHEEKVKVSIKDNGDGTLTITPDYGENIPQFKNIYKATGDLSIKAYKKVKGSVDKNYPTFNFILKNKATGLKVAEGVNNDKGEINFSKIKFTEKDIGKTFEFIAEEIKGNDKNIVYDNSQIQYTVKVVDNGDGKLSFDVIIKDLKTDDINNKENEPVFVNKYLPGKLKVEKRIQNGDPNKEFKFKIKFTGDEKDIPTGKFNLTRDKLKEAPKVVFDNVSQSSIDKMVDKGGLRPSNIIRGAYQALNKVNSMFTKNDLANSMKNVLKSSRTALMSLIKPTTSYASAPKVFYSGTMGTVTWEIFDNRELVLRPTTGSVGEFKILDMYHLGYNKYYQQSVNSIFDDYSYAFDKVIFQDTVIVDRMSDSIENTEWYYNMTFDLLDAFKHVKSLDLSGLKRQGSNELNISSFKDFSFSRINLPSHFKFYISEYTNSNVFTTFDPNKYLDSWSREDKTYTNIPSSKFSKTFNENPSAMAGWWVRDEKPTNYFIKFNSNGANGLIEDMKVKYGDTFTMADASKLYMFNKEFVEWNTNPNGTGTSYKAGQSYSNLANAGQTVTLYAIFKDKDNSVEIKNGEGEFTLRANESVTFDNLLSGLEYEIYEETDEGWQLVEAKNDKGVIKPNEEITSTFTNKYDPKSTNAYIKGRKLLDGQGSLGYKFNLIKDGQVVDTQTSTEGGFISFKKLDFNTKGEFNYTIKEVKGSDNNIIYDEHEEKVKVVVSEDKKGNLKADITYDSDGVVFNNKTKPSKLVLKKLVEGTDNKTKNFKFSVNIDGNVQEVTLKNNEVKEFTNLKADSRYEIKEVNIPDGYKLKSIDKASGVVGVNEVVNVIATNEYNAKGSFNIKAKKLLENKDLKQGQFKFVLLDENNKTVAESNNDVNGNIDFGLVDIEKAGNFTYKIKEINDSQKDIVYDTHEEIVKVNAVDENNGNLKVNVAYDTDGAVFKNNYKPEIPKEANFGNLKISKNVLNLTDSIKNKEYSFKISLTKDSKPLAGEYNAQSNNGLTQVVKNGATLTIKNNEVLTIDKLPENVDVKIEEMLPKGFKLNTNSVVQTKIIKDKTSELKLVNEYKPIGSFNFKGTKKLLGEDISKYKFTFTVVKNGELIQKAYNNEDGEILFKDITLSFEDIGKTYEYEIFESNDRQKDIKYDNKIYKVKVEIKDDGEGHITGVVNTDDIIFTNAHQQLVVTGLNSSMIVMVSLLGLIAVAYVISKKSKEIK